MKPNPLIIIGAIFAASLAGRAIGVADAALEKTDKEKSAAQAAIAQAALDAPAPAVSQQSEDHVAEPAVDAAPPAVDSDGVARNSKDATAITSYDAAKTSALLAAIKDRARYLDEKEAQLEDRQRMLEIIEARIEDRLQALKESNDDLSKLVAFADEAAEKDIVLLSKMYEQMKPQKAGEIFNKMDPTFAAGFLTEMNSENAALILTNMNTDRAYETSMIIASRNASVHSQ